MTQLQYAFDRQSARSVDSDGRMRVKNCVLSTAEVNPYRGQEIPGWKDLDLDPETVYDLYRDPDELRASAKSFEGVPLMIKHIPQTAEEPRKEYIGGSVHNVSFDGKHLRGDILVWDGRAIELIESDEQSDLSCSYRYKPVMTTGDAAGAKYDGLMAKIQGNHVALVDEGRATGAHVADAALQTQHPDPSLQGDSMAFPDPKAAPAAAAPAAPAAAAAPPAAPAAPAAPTPDAGMAEVGAALKHIGTTLEAIMARLPGAEPAAPAAPPADPAAAAAPGAADADIDPPDGPGPDLTLEPMPKIDGEGGDTPGELDADGNPVLPPSDQDGTGARGGPTPHAAMDAKGVASVVQAAVLAERRRAAAVEDAKRATRNVIGEVAMDDAGAIYRTALEQVGVDVAQIGKGAERVAWDAYRVAAGAAAGVRTQVSASHAADAKGDGGNAAPSYMKHLASISVKG